MNTKSNLIKRLEQRAINLENEYIDNYLASKGVEYYNGESEYNDTQRFIHSQDLDKSNYPLQIQYLNKVLRNVNQKNPTELSNINDNTQFQVYQFLEKLLEPAINYFTDGDKSFNVVEHLAMKYDKEFPCEKNGFDEMVYYEGADIYCSMKREAVENLEQAFVNRGLVNPRSKHDSESISKTMTANRYNYLNELADLFNKNPESEEVINFVNNLPNNTWFDSTIYLECDSNLEFEELNKKYIPNYKTYTTVKSS
jgi:hypothetical protein